MSYVCRLKGSNVNYAGKVYQEGCEDYESYVNLGNYAASEVSVSEVA